MIEIISIETDVIVTVAKNDDEAEDDEEVDDEDEAEVDEVEHDDLHDSVEIMKKV